MKKYIGQQVRKLLTAFLLVPALASAADGHSIALQGGGNQAAMPCVACHGEGLRGNPELVAPRIAGLPEDYIAKQLRDFNAGSRHNEQMQAVARALTQDEIAAVAKDFSVLPKVNVLADMPLRPAPDTAAWLDMRGAWERNIPPCTSCHGSNGMGIGNAFPPLAGQSAAYLKAQLHAFKNAAKNEKPNRKKQMAAATKRLNDPNGLMRHIAASLTDAEIKMLAEYFSAWAVSDEPIAPNRVFLK
ncbi:MAG: c-type cytochrome [Gallionellaceae bacterium]|jgi:cytochrome c553